MNEPKALGARIRELREEIGISLRRVAREAGVSAAFLSDVELGRRHPSEDVMKAIAKSLGVHVSDLRKHDPRAAIEALSRMARENPHLGQAIQHLMKQMAAGQMSQKDLAIVLSKIPAREGKR